MRYTTEREMEGDGDEKGAKQHVRHKMTPPCHITTGINTTNRLIVSPPEKKSSHFFFSFYVVTVGQHRQKSSRDGSCAISLFKAKC